MNICEHLAASARLFPEKEAVVYEGRRFTYSELDHLSVNAAMLLVDAGVKRGDRVAIMLPNAPSFIVWYYATLRIGAIAVSVSTRLLPGEVAFLVSDCEAKAFVADQSGMNSVKAELPDSVGGIFEAADDASESNGTSIGTATWPPSTWIDADPNEPALILYTSGTTGVAKGATLSHMNVRSNVAAFNHLCDMNSSDRILLAVPLFHCFGQNALMNSAFNVGATIVLQRQFDPHDSARLIEEESVSQLYGVPTMFRLFHDCCQPQQLSTVRYCFSAAATLPVQVSQRWQSKFGMPIYEGYGLTETSPFASYNHRNRYEVGSIGTPIDCVEMKIVDTESGETCGPGELGEIAIRGPNVMLGYWKRPGDTRDAVRDGWFHSGDIGRVDDKGFFFIVDRVKDMIDVGGTNVFPAEVERVLLDHHHVSEAAVVGLADDVFGEQVVAFVVTAGDAKSLPDSGEQIKRYAKSKLANYKAPGTVIVLDELPRNPSGKVLKTKLREYKYNTEDANQAVANSKSREHDFSASNDLVSRKPVLREKLSATYATSRDAIAIEYLQDAVKTLSGSDQVPEPDSRFLDVGLDSLMIVDLSRQLQAEIGHGREIPATLVFDYPSIRDLAGYLVRTIAANEDSPTTTNASGVNAKTSTTEANSAVDKPVSQSDVEALSEEEALAELLRELED